MANDVFASLEITWNSDGPAVVLLDKDIGTKGIYSMPQSFIHLHDAKRLTSLRIICTLINLEELQILGFGASVF